MLPPAKGFMAQSQTYPTSGSITHVHIPGEKRQKLDPKSEKYILAGYSLEQKGYKCVNPSTKKVQVSRDAVFDESTS